MDLQAPKDYMIARMCGGESQYRDNHQHLIDQGLIPNPMYTGLPTVPQANPTVAQNPSAYPTPNNVNVYPTSNGMTNAPPPNGNLPPQNGMQNGLPPVHHQQYLPGGYTPMQSPHQPVNLEYSNHINHHHHHVDQINDIYQQPPVGGGGPCEVEVPPTSVQYAHAHQQCEVPPPVMMPPSTEGRVVKRRSTDGDEKEKKEDLRMKSSENIQRKGAEIGTGVQMPQPKKRGRRKVNVETMLRVDLLDDTSQDDLKEGSRRGGRGKPVDPWHDRKASAKPFVQDGPCFALIDVAPKKFGKCRECRQGASDDNEQCRFNEFRRLKFVRDNLTIEGFTDSTDARNLDRDVWLPSASDQACKLDIRTAITILTNVGDIFCDLLQQEMKVLTEFKYLLQKENGAYSPVRWKRLYGVREMCDVCQTTIFNLHWTCASCGFVTCIDCFRGRVEKRPLLNGRSVGDHNSSEGGAKDEFLWLFCGNPKQSKQHLPAKLMMTQIIPGDILKQVNRQLHEVRDRWGVMSSCACCEEKVKNGQEALRDNRSKCVTKTLTASLTNVILSRKNNSRFLHESAGLTNSSNSLAVLADLAVMSRSRLPSIKVEDLLPSQTEVNLRILETAEMAVGRVRRTERLPVSVNKQQPFSLRVCTKVESAMQYPRTPHSWLCNGRLLLLHEATNETNLELFQEQWKRGQPVMVAHVSEILDMNLWHPDAFLRDFGDQKSTLVDCKTGAELDKFVPMKRFWEGFECFGKRMKDKNGEHMLLKLKDWPPNENFSEVLPKRFEDLMKALPLPQYTKRDGSLNLADRLPGCFVRPDLGPKLYNAYGSALFPSKGTTNLHLDISDAANVMVYVGIPRDGDCRPLIEEALRAVNEAGCDVIQMKRVREKGMKVGAVWHIFNAKDADDIRHMLKKVMVEKGMKLEANSDPIHDQIWYLDRELRTRLFREYGVEGYAIAQCLGDTVFIPAGAPHQVRNLHSCIKVAEDFVSPENIAHCFRLTNEFRYLSDTHTNHEDKLQIKNVVYHAVKDSISVLDENDKRLPL